MRLTSEVSKLISSQMADFSKEDRKLHPFKEIRTNRQYR